MRKVYLDNAATTALSPRVLEQMMPYLTTIYGNPSSPHSFGQEARKGVEHARDQVAKALNALPEEIIFTGCGTESDNRDLGTGALKLHTDGRQFRLWSDKARMGFILPKLGF